MKKTLLAAALLAGFAGAAQAQSTSVTLYGIIDTGLGYNKVKVKGSDSASRVGMINGAQSGSRWGLRGSEDLGDGLRAIFNIESGFDSSNGTSGQGGLFRRQATLGLAGDAWGTLELGRQTNMASKYLGGSIDPFGAGFGQANLGHGISAANTVRYDNMVLYRTPDFNGFQFGIGYSFATDGRVANFETSDNVRALTAGLRYANGPLAVVATYDQLRHNHGYHSVGYVDAQHKAKPRSYAIGVAYDFEVVKLAAAYARTTDGWFQGQAATGFGNVYGTSAFADNFKANSYLLGVTVPVGSGAIVSSWQHVSPKNDNLTGSSYVQVNSQGNVIKNDENMDVVSVGYTYDFSKRTNLYAFVSYAKDYAFIDGAKSTATGVGLRHRF